MNPIKESGCLHMIFYQLFVLVVLFSVFFRHSAPGAMWVSRMKENKKRGRQGLGGTPCQPKLSGTIFAIVMALDVVLGNQSERSPHVLRTLPGG